MKIELDVSPTMAGQIDSARGAMSRQAFIEGSILAQLAVNGVAVKVSRAPGGKVRATASISRGRPAASPGLGKGSFAPVPKRPKK